MVLLCYLHSIDTVSSLFPPLLLLFCVVVILTLAKWCSLSDVYGRKFLFQAGMAGIALYISINIFAATRFNVFGSNVYYLEAVIAGFMPLGQLINPAVFAYCGRCNVARVSLKTKGGQLEWTSH